MRLTCFASSAGFLRQSLSIYPDECIIPVYWMQPRVLYA